jgi:hypothetical protein
VVYVKEKKLWELKLDSSLRNVHVKFDLKDMRSLVMQVYLEKIASDINHDNFKEPRQSLEDFVYDFFQVCVVLSMVCAVLSMVCAVLSMVCAVLSMVCAVLSMLCAVLSM